MSSQARTSSYPAPCPKCSGDVVMVSIGDPDTPMECAVSKGDAMTLSVMTHYSFLSCHGCGHSWDLPKQSC